LLHIVAVTVSSGAWWAFKGESCNDWAAAKEEVSNKKMKEKMIKHTRKKNACTHAWGRGNEWVVP
jgi:hypothetical protein